VEDKEHGAFSSALANSMSTWYFC